MLQDLDFEILNKENFVSLKLEENGVYFGEIKLKFIDKPVEALLESERSPTKTKKNVKNKIKKSLIEDEIAEKDVYSVYKCLNNKTLQISLLEEEEDLDLIIKNPHIKIMREGMGTMVHYQINEEILSKYEGEWEEDQMKGTAKVFYPNKGTYSGQIVLGKRQGFGMFEWPSGERYSGQWTDDKMQGYGVFFNIGNVSIFNYIYSIKKNLNDP